MYQHIRVAKHQFEDGEGLLLMLDRTFVGAGFLHSNDLPFPYTRYYKLYELVNPDAGVSFSSEVEPTPHPRSSWRSGRTE